MAYDVPEELRDEGFQVLEAQAAVLEAQAAAENLALELEHSESMQRETEIASDMHGPLAEQFTAVPGFSHDGHDFFGMSFDDIDARSSSSRGADAAVTVTPGYSAENTFGFARVALQPEGVKHFWETGFWNDFMNPDVSFLSSFDGNFKRPFDNTFDGASEEVAEVAERKPKTLKQGATFMDHVRDVPVASWKDQRDAEWQVAIFRWHAMLSVWDPKVTVVGQMMALDGFGAQAQLLVDIFCNRAPATVMKRCRSMSRMTNYFIARGRSFPCDESQVYEFMCVERSAGAPCSRLKGFIEALTFCRHVLGVTEFDSATTSRRCQGVASLDVHHKLKQSEPLSVKQLVMLHGVLFEDDEIWNRVFAGMLLFCVYARSRWSDAQHGEKLLEDLDSSGACAYIEVSTGVHKTAKALQLRHMYLPLVAPCEGVTSGNWGTEWCRVRKELGIHDLSVYPLMPAPNSQREATVRPLSTSEAGSWMRDLLKIDNADKSQRFSSHSLKATCLSYAAKRGLPFEDRLSLGYHTHSLKMALVYSRDGASRPLRVLETLLREIRLKRFDPNDTRSGRLSQLQKLEADEKSETFDDVGKSFEIVSQVSSENFLPVSEAGDAGENVDDSDHATTGSESESDVETTVLPRVSYKDIKAPEGTRLHQHLKLKTLHLMKTENRVVFLCGRKTSHLYGVAEGRQPFDTPKCRQCFRAKLD